MFFCSGLFCKFMLFMFGERRRVVVWRTLCIGALRKLLIKRFCINDSLSSSRALALVFRIIFQFLLSRVPRGVLCYHLQLSRVALQSRYYFQLLLSRVPHEATGCYVHLSTSD